MENRDYTLLVILIIVTAVAVSAADAAGIPKKAISTVGAFIESDLPTTTVFTDVARTITATITLNKLSASSNIVDPTDNSKALGFSLSGMTTGKTLTLSSSQTTTQTLTIPNISGGDTLATLGLGQTFSGANTFSHNTNTFTASNTGVVISNPSNSFATTLAGGAVSANRTLNLPVITGTDTLATLGLTQTFTGANTFSSSLTLGNKITTYNNIATAGPGVAAVYGATLQKTESAADTNVLTFTPPATAGTYRITFTISQSAASGTDTLGWTATWKDSNGHAQAPTNLSLFAAGTAAPALTVTGAANGAYYGTAMIDIDNSGTAIVVKLTKAGTGTFTAKVSAVIEQIQ